MMFKRAVALLMCVCVALSAADDSLQAFRQWSRSHGRVYTAAEAQRRAPIFAANAETVRLLGQSHPATRFALNRFADLTAAEFYVFATGMLAPTQAAGAHMPVVRDARSGSELNYTYTLPPIKDQGNCGSCWAFSLVANSEGQTFRKNGGQVVSLSEQQLVSCDSSCRGCNGGWLAKAGKYVLKHGLASEEAYPYTSGGSGGQGFCNAFAPVAQFSKYHDFQAIPQDETIMQLLEKYGPLSVGIEGDSDYFRFYSGGIMDNHTACGELTNHAVTLVGYGTEQGRDFWLVRNSWGAAWGIGGYFKLIRGSNQCGINWAVSTIEA